MQGKRWASRIRMISSRDKFNETFYKLTFTNNLGICLNRIGERSFFLNIRILEILDFGKTNSMITPGLIHIHLLSSMTIGFLVLLEW